MKYFFILGRNPILSKAEVYSVLTMKKVKFEEIVFDKNLLILEIEEDVKLDVQEFGGILKYGVVVFTGKSIEELTDFIADNDLVDVEKFSYSINGNLSWDVEEILSDKFKQERRKAVVRRRGRGLKLQGTAENEEEEEIEILKGDFEFFVHEGGDNTIYFGIIRDRYSYKDVKSRDMKKPVRRESLAISPRLSKILINLSQVEKGGLLLDPFCGVAGILQEALIKGVNCYGIDKDLKAIENARKNLRWVENNYGINASYILLNTDARKTPESLKFDAIVSEPELGEIVRRKPNEIQASQIIERFEKLIVSVIQRVKKMKKPGAKIVFTAPAIRQYSIDIKSIEKKTGLKQNNLEGVRFPIKEFRRESFIGRDIWVLE
jgi:tRNA G10  N-methylase Trm11